MSILITGGAGFIGSHTCVELLNAGYEITVLDNYCNCQPESLARIRKITGKTFPFYEADIRDRAALDRIFQENKIDAVIHFAGLKAVGESVRKPLEYYENNLTGTITLLEAMRDAGCKKIVFSSSATVYGMNNVSPLTEDMPIGGTTNPYGTTKYMIELILRDLYIADPTWSITVLRYFNPVGAHESGLIGENPNGIPNNLMPYITQVAIGRLPQLRVFGGDYDTPDGTGVRDYIHVVDLALGHIKAVEQVLDGEEMHVYNLGTGTGYSVLDMIRAMEKASGRTIPYEVVDRRPGDLATCYSDPSKAERELGWKAERGLDAMCEDAWRWQEMNPNGF